MCALVYGFSLLKVENRFIDYFSDDTEIYQGMYLLDKELGGTATLDIVIDAPKESAEDISLDDDLFDDSINAIKSPQYRRLLKDKEKEENNEDTQQNPVQENPRKNRKKRRRK